MQAQSANFYHRIAAAAIRFGDRPAIEMTGAGGTSLSYRDLIATATRFAAWLASGGIGRGDRRQEWEQPEAEPQEEDREGGPTDHGVDEEVWSWTIRQPSGVRRKSKSFNGADSRLRFSANVLFCTGADKPVFPRSSTTSSDFP